MEALLGLTAVAEAIVALQKKIVAARRVADGTCRTARLGHRGRLDHAISEAETAGASGVYAVGVCRAATGPAGHKETILFGQVDKIVLREQLRHHAPTQRHRIGALDKGQGPGASTPVAQRARSATVVREQGAAVAAEPHD